MTEASGQVGVAAVDHVGVSDAGGPVGAAGVSDVAKRLETAGKQLDIDRIREETRELLASYRELETPLKEILEM